MLSGRRLDLLNPSPLDIEIEDIAHGLARVARWNGQTTGDHGLSVAQHSVLVEEAFCLLNTNASHDDRLVTLLHDAAEYVIGDMITPFKTVLGADYSGVEDRIQSAVYLRVGLPALPSPDLKKRIKAVDKAVAYFESTRLAGFEKAEARQFFGQPPKRLMDHGPLNRLQPWTSQDAYAAFMRRFSALMHGR